VSKNMKAIRLAGIGIAAAAAILAVVGTLREPMPVIHLERVEVVAPRAAMPVVQLERVEVVAKRLTGADRADAHLAGAPRKTGG
jgi:hypothetical protein